MGIIFFLILFLVAQFGGLFGRSGLDAQLKPVVSSYSFSVGGWEIHNLPLEFAPSFHHQPGVDDVSPVIEYFALGRQVSDLEQQALTAGDSSNATAIRSELARVEKQQDALAGTVEAVMEQQIQTVLHEQGIYSPIGGLRIDFPPVRFKLARPPNLLVISPLDKIEYLKGVMLNSDLTPSQINSIEDRVDGLNVSSLVVGIGGLGATVPAFVASNEDLQSALDTAAHEWTHQYLAFKPLGFLYVLDLTGIRRDPDIVPLNETLADMIGHEIGSLVYQQYYAQVVSPGGSQASPPAQKDSTPAFDFNAQMRLIRKTVDTMLSEGKVTEAEQYMSAQRDYLQSKGYYIRKLNQAYFAFYGSYTDSPTSIDPIGAEMQQLRNESPSIVAFLNKMSTITSRQALKSAVSQ